MFQKEEIQIQLQPKLKTFTTRTKKGVAYQQEKTNQDSLLAQANLNGSEDNHLFGVYDGHGKPTF